MCYPTRGRLGDSIPVRYWYVCSLLFHVMVSSLYVVWMCSRLCGNLFLAKCWFNEFWAKETRHQKLSYAGNKWLEMRVLHLRGKKKSQDKYLSTVLLKDSFSSQTWNRCKTNMLATTIHVSSFLCSVCQGKKKMIYESLFSTNAASPADIYRLCFRKAPVYRWPTEFPFLLQGHIITA